MIPFGLEALMTVSLPIARRASKCFIPGASAIYLCNEGSGTSLLDHSGNALHGTFGAAGAAPTWTATGISLDGGDLVTLPDVGALLSPGATYQVVFRPGADVTTTQYLISCGTSKAGGLAIATGKLLIAAPDANSGHNLYTAASTIAASTWIGVAGTITWGGALVAYLNGVSAATGSTDGTWTTPGASSQAIGARTSAIANPLVGDVAAVLVYPTVLTPAQIAQNHTALKSIMAARGVTLA